MVVFSQKEFNGVDIDRIGIGSRWGLLPMMMFVNVAINSLDVKCPMKEGIKKVINNEKGNDWEQEVGEGNFLQGPFGIRFVVKEFHKNVYKWDGCEFVQGDV